MRIFAFIATLSALAFAAGCGYTLQTSKSPLLDKEGVRKVYINPVINNTYKAGVENTVYNAMIRMLSASRRIKVVQDPADADAILQGIVDVASPDPGASAAAQSLNPSGVGIPNTTNFPSEYKDTPITTEYSARLICSFNLVRRNPPPGKKSTLWASSFARTKSFPSANQLGPLGTTAALINDSEFDRTLGDMAKSMMIDVHESMLSMF